MSGQITAISRKVADNRHSGGPEPYIIRLLDHIDALQQALDGARNRVRGLEDRLSKYEAVERTIDVRPALPRARGARNGS